MGRGWNRLEREDEEQEKVNEVKVSDESTKAKSEERTESQSGRKEVKEEAEERTSRRDEDTIKEIGRKANMRRGKARRSSGRRHVCGFEWGENQARSFTAIKKAIIQNALFGGDEALQYHIATDASKTALGGVLFQILDSTPGTKASSQNRPKHRIIMFLSKPFLPAETRYSTTEREALAVLRCLEEVQWLILGSPFSTIVYTDHQALVSLLKKDDAHGRIARWQVRLSEYDVEYHHVSGVENRLADGLSRMPLVGIMEDVFSGKNISTAAIETMGSMGEAQADGLKSWEEWLKESWYRPIILYKITGSIDGPEGKRDMDKSRNVRRVLRRSSSKFILSIPHENQESPQLYYRERNGNLSTCLKAKEVMPVLHQLHDMHGHFAAGLVLKRAIGKYYWPTRVHDIHYYCHSCHACQLVGPLRPSVGLLPIVELQPFDMIGMDNIGPITPPAISSNCRYIVIAVDYFTRFLFAQATLSPTGENAVGLPQEQIVKFFGWPGSVYTDNGPHFVAGIFARTLRERFIRHFPAPKSHPSSVGLSERYVQLLMTVLRTTIIAAKGAGDSWDQFIPTAVHAINTRTLRVHGFTPSELLLGFNPRLLTALPAPIESAHDRAVLSVLAALATGNPESVVSDQLLRTIDYNVRLAKLDEIRRHALAKNVNEAERLENEDGQWERLTDGDLVLLRRFEIDKHKGRKLEARWEGPFRLSDISWHGRSGRLRDINTRELVKVRRAGLQERCHLNDLKRFVVRDESQLGLEVTGMGGRRGIHGIGLREREEGTIRKEGGNSEVVFIDIVDWGNLLCLSWEMLFDFTMIGR